jgi:SAM-dependent methyltransferase
MFSVLYEHLKRPALYERTTELFWNNPHIAKQMLDAHLDPDIDAASRKPDFINRCADWITSFELPKDKSLLDIGCGPGLYTKQFAKRGFRVTGIDFSDNSIAYARDHDSESNYILQNYLEMDFENEFNIITLIYYDYGALIPKERVNLLGRVKKALKSGGLFLLDVYTPLRGKDKHDSTSWYINPDGGFWSAAPHLCLDSEHYYDDIAEGHRTVIVEEGKIRCYNLWDCYFTQQSLLDETAPFGFSDINFYNDATGAPYTDNSQTMCAVLQKGDS